MFDSVKHFIIAAIAVCYQITNLTGARCESVTIWVMMASNNDQSARAHAE